MDIDHGARITIDEGRHSGIYWGDSERIPGYGVCCVARLGSEEPDVVIVPKRRISLAINTAKAVSAAAEKARIGDLRGY